MNRPPEKSECKHSFKTLNEDEWQCELCGKMLKKHFKLSKATWDACDVQLVPEPPPLAICFYDNKNILCGTVACKDGKMTFEGNADESAKRLWQCWGGMFEGEVKKAAKAMCEQRLVDATGVSVPDADELLDGKCWEIAPGFIEDMKTLDRWRKRFSAEAEKVLMEVVAYLEQCPQVHLSKEDRARVLRVLGRSM